MPGKNETRVAVLLGGRSPEHDVSVISGLQALKAIDQERFIAFPVYIDPRGRWLVGDLLAERRNYLPDARIESELTEVTLSLGCWIERTSRARFRKNGSQPGQRPAGQLFHSSGDSRSWRSCSRRLSKPRPGKAV